MEALFGKRTRFPSPHASGCNCHPVDAADTIWNIPADFFKTLTPEELAAASYVIFALKAIPARIVAAIFCERGSGHAKFWIFVEFANQKFQVIGIERYVRIEIADNVEVNRLHSFESGSEGINLAGEVSIGALLAPEEFDPRNLLRKWHNNLCGIIGRSIINNNPALGPNGLNEH